MSDDTPSEFRSVTVNARTGIGAVGPAMWAAQIVVGLLNRSQDQDTPKGPANDVFRAAAVRVLVQDTDPIPITVGDKTLPGYHSPRLVQAAVRAHDSKNNDFGNSTSVLTICGGGASPASAATAELDPHVRQLPVPPYSEVLLGLNDTIKSKLGSEIELPELTLEAGAIETLVRLDQGTASKWLGIKLGKTNTIFGAQSNMMFEPVKIGSARYLAVWLVPEGIELEASLADPFRAPPAAGAPAVPALKLRLLLTYDAEVDQFVLRPGKAAQNTADALKLRASFDGLVHQLGGDGNPLLVEVDPKGLPFAWSLGKGVTGGALDASTSQIFIDSGATRVRLNSEAPDRSDIPTVCQLSVRSAAIQTADRSLIIKGNSGGTSSSSSAPNPADVIATFRWVDKNPGTASLNAGTAAPQVIDTATFEQRLRVRYATAGLLKADTRMPLYAFLPLERGVLQLPLSFKVTSKGAPPAAADRSAFSGLIRSRIPIAANRDDASIEVTTAVSAQITVVLAAERTTTAIFTGARGTASGLVFAAAASPSPASILPPLDTGPIACEPLDIVFGDPQLSSVISVRWAIAETPQHQPSALSMTLTLADKAKPDDKAGDAILWRAHPRLALVSTMPMTRTRFDATRPSATRDLVPFTLPGKSRAFVLTTVLNDANQSPFPSLTEPAAGASTISLDPVWPWPTADDSSKKGEANDAISNVSLSSLTLPGIEMALDGTADWNKIEASLRYDLPILGELFASATLPRAPAPGGSPQNDYVSEHAPTALEPTALTTFWRRTANRHALSRTINDRVTDWLPLGTAPDLEPITSFVEPYTFTSGFDVTLDFAGLPLGAYALFGKTVAASSALSGWSGNLSTQQGGTLEITGFSARLNSGTAGGGHPALFDTRGIGQGVAPLVRPLLPQGLIELRDTARLDLDNNKILQTDRVALTAVHIGFVLAGIHCGLRLRDLPMTVDQNGNLSFTPTVTNKDNSRTLTGPEGDLGPDGSVFERSQLPNAVFEWSFYKAAEPSLMPSFVFRLGALDLRPLRLAGVTFKNESTGLRLWRFEIIANVEQPAAVPDGLGPINDDLPYAAGNPVALAFEMTADSTQATLTALHPVSAVNRAIVIGADATAVVQFRALASLSYGDVDGKMAGVSRAHGSVPIVLEMNLAPSGVAGVPIKIATAAMKAVLFGSQTRIAFNTMSLTETLAFEYRGQVVTPAQLQIPRVELTWSREAKQPILLLCSRLRLPATFADVLPAGVTRNLIDWQLGATLRWFGAVLSGASLGKEDYFSFDVDHDNGTVTLTVHFESLSEEAHFVDGWPITKAPFTLALAVAFPPRQTADLFPAVTSAGFVEATCGMPDGLYIRHRMVKPGQVQGRSVDWDSRILVSFSKLSLASAIAWPLEGLTATFPDPDRFTPSSRVAADWRQTIKVDSANAHAHGVDLVVRNAELPAINLVESGNIVRLAAPWTFPALATHTLKSNSTSVTWTSVDEIVVGHMTALEGEAEQTIKVPPGELAFVPRFRDSAPNLQPFAVSAGVFSKALARAGIPTLELLTSLKLAAKSARKSDLFISGAALMEVAAEKEDMVGFGYRVVTPWIAPLFDDKALGGLQNIPQAPWSGSVSTYDLVPHATSRLDQETIIPFGTSDASVAWIKRYRDRIAEALPFQSALHFEPVSQAVIEDVELPKDGDDPMQALSRPIWLRTLAAWKGILTSGPQQRLAGRAVTVMPILVGDPKASIRTTAVRLAMYRSVESQPVDNDPVASDDPAWPATRSYEVIVLTRDAVTTVAVANADAKTLNESRQPPIAGDQRNRLAQLALAVPDEPLAAALGELTDVGTDLLTDDQKQFQTHLVRGFLELPGYLDTARQPHALRDRTRTVLSSAALAWPRAAVRADWNGVPQPAGLELGDQRPLQDAHYSWAGDVRSFSLTNGTTATDNPFRQASVMTIGQRALFRRPTDEDLTAPPDRALTPVPPRARVPGADSVERGLRAVRLKTSTKTAEGDNVPEPAIAAILPGNFEVVTTGRRPGVLFFQYDGLTFADGDAPFDPHQLRFGRPADRGPVVFRQTRAPRSTVFKPTNDLSRRRLTFIGSEYFDDTNQLLPFALARGSMTALRTSQGDGSSATVETILLRLAKGDVSPFSISADWDGTLVLTATLYASKVEDATAKLAQVGMTASTARFVLAIDGTQLTFPMPLPGVPKLNPYLKPRTDPSMVAFDIAIPLALANGDKALARRVLQSADADSTANLTLSLPDPKMTPLAPNVLQPGPPRMLVIAVPIAASQQPSLHIETATVAFGDPAYDREISSKTLSANQLVETVTYLLSLDRLEYDLASTLFFAAGPIIQKAGTDPNWDTQSSVTMTLQLGVLYKSEQAVVHPTPLAIGWCKTVDDTFPPRHDFKPGLGYSIMMSDLRKAVPNNPDGTGGYTLQAASLAPGDRVVVTVSWGGSGSLEVAATLVADPVLSPPAAVYGLATLDRNKDATRLTSSLFATAPLPQIVEFQDLAGDLARGLVRRRALFVWPFCPRSMPPDGKPYGALVKFDRAGGGQLPDSESDFQPLLK